MISIKLFPIIIFIFFPICKWKEFELFQLSESLKKNVLMHRPSIKKSLAKRVTIYIEKPKFWYLIFETKSGNCQITCLLIKSVCLNFGTAFISNSQRWLSWDGGKVERYVMLNFGDVTAAAQINTGNSFGPIGLVYGSTI